MIEGRKFKVGDLVRIRDVDDMIREYGIGISSTTVRIKTGNVQWYTPGMDYLCGVIFRITSLEERIGGDIVVRGCEESATWTLNENMLTLVEEADINVGEFVNFSDFLDRLRSKDF